MLVYQRVSDDCAWGCVGCTNLVSKWEIERCYNVEWGLSKFTICLDLWLYEWSSHSDESLSMITMSHEKIGSQNLWVDLWWWNTTLPHFAAIILIWPPWNFNIRTPYFKKHTFWEAHHISLVYFLQQKSRVLVFCCFPPPFLSISHIFPPFLFRFGKSHLPTPIKKSSTFQGVHHQNLWYHEHLKVLMKNLWRCQFTRWVRKWWPRGTLGKGGRKGWGCHDQSPMFFSNSWKLTPHLGWHYTSFSQ